MSLDVWFTEKHEDKLGITLKVKKVLYSGQSEFQKVDVVETEAYGNMLLLDGLVMTTEKDEFYYHEMISHIPLLANGNPEKVLVIGGGDGGTIREVLKHPSVKEAVLCEIDQKVIDVSKEFLPSIAGKLDDPRVTINVEDAIEYIKRHKNEFDVVLIDSTDPLGPGVGLFTEEFYTNVKESLKEGGVMAAQTESPPVPFRSFTAFFSSLWSITAQVSSACIPCTGFSGSFWGPFSW